MGMISRRTFCTCCLTATGVFAVSRAAHSQELLNLEGSVACAGRKSITLGNVYSFKASSEAMSLVGKICEAVGLPQNFEVRVAAVSDDIANAAAVIAYYGTPDAKRLVLYNELWVQDYLRSTGDEYWSGVALLAHECGHHLSGHTLDGQGSKPPKELEADSFAGFIVAKLGGTREQALALFEDFPLEATETHPARSDRLQAVAVGWRNAGVPTRSESEWANIRVNYFRKRKDGTKVDEVLSDLGIQANHYASELEDADTNHITCSDDVPVSAVRALALALHDRGIAIQSIYQHADKAFSGINIEFVGWHRFGLSRSVLEQLDRCPPRSDPTYGTYQPRR
ncbi:hypothetical protein OIU34_02505 [Pararhizobium sp. BT-229]|uniref:hypothetical protein n=1 Tax=Pararhizobium sp. BT-229 TaxID=2986923 RepID=UPI0021F79CAD|nr:hypothetical protein [Pararhizobium sp. BT-229]MCV9960759.1 hypothetical protein [Pararhizobium sp. BT-229]